MRPRCKRQPWQILGKRYRICDNAIRHNKTQGPVLVWQGMRQCYYTYLPTSLQIHIIYFMINNKSLNLGSPVDQFVKNGKNQPKACTEFVVDAKGHIITETFTKQGHIYIAILMPYFSLLMCLKLISLNESNLHFKIPHISGN